MKTPPPVPSFLQLGDPDPRAPHPPALESHEGSIPVPPETQTSKIDIPQDLGKNGGMGEVSLHPPQDLGKNGGTGGVSLQSPGKGNFPEPKISPEKSEMPGGLVPAPRVEDEPEYDEHDPKIQAFLRVLEKCGVVTRALDISGLNRNKAYRLRRNSEEFARVWKQATKYRSELLEDEAIRRAVHGVEEPVFYMGAICGYKQSYSDSLLSKLLEGNMPEKYRQNHKVEVEGNVGLATLVLPAATTAEQWIEQNNGTIIEQLPENEYD